MFFSKKLGVFCGLLFMTSLLLFGKQSHNLALAALGGGQNNKVDLEQASFNPHPNQHDFELPMPGGLTMVLRAVAIPADSPLKDFKFEMGLNKVKEDRSFYEKPVEGYISSPISYMDLPPSWQKKLPADEKAGGFYYYFLGKYEVSNAQWQAVMGGELAGDPSLPKTNISWYDMQAFLQKYNA
ncbi:MAG: hypothetical protein IJS50_02570, partial [Desulfovibrio sp.]|nr:hypothetical protein [Desulfovibrio sp.]